MSHQEENQTSPHIQPIQLIPEPLSSNSSEQPKKQELPQIKPTIRREYAYSPSMNNEVILYPGMWTYNNHDKIISEKTVNL